jgi:hypothetical protein
LACLSYAAEREHRMLVAIRMRLLFDQNVSPSWSAVIVISFQKSKRMECGGKATAF